MRTSLSRLESIERFVSRTMPAEESVLFSANLLLDKTLVIDLQHQHEAYAIITMYSRQALKTELNQIHNGLRNDKTFWDRILTIFEKE